MKRLLILAAALAAMAQPAAASDLGWESAGSFQVRVTIGPIAAPLAAAQSGAIGLWSMSNGSRGLMLQAPSDLKAGEAAEVGLYAMRTGGLTVRAMGSNLRVRRGEARPDRDFARQAFTIEAAPGLCSQSGVYVISTL